MAEVIADTTSGRFRGFRTEGVSTFLGIPYGQAHGPSRRFRPALPALPHAGAVDALWFGPAAAQFDGRLTADPDAPDPIRLYFPRSGGQTEATPISEDCLTLNVWSPATNPSARLPVLVWFHGGAFRSGSGAATLTAGDALAATGRAVVVTVNHRLGIFGFLALDHLLGAEFAGSGAAGLTDMVLSLEWVRDNITQFGGDPRQVTVFGQSGGGTKVASLLRMPSATGLFRRCIAQSPAGAPLRPEAGRAQTEQFLSRLALDDPRELTRLPMSTLLHAQSRLDNLAPAPVADGITVLDAADPAVQELSRGVDLMVGTTVHEWSLLIAGRPWYPTLDDDSLAGVIERYLPGADGAMLARAGRDDHPDEPTPLLLCRLLSAHTFGLTAARIAELHADGAMIFRYEFGYESSAQPGPLGATHCIDVPCVFGTVRWTPLLGDRPDRWPLERTVMDTWLHFAETGHPGDSRTAWPASNGPASSGAGRRFVAGGLESFAPPSVEELTRIVDPGSYI